MTEPLTYDPATVRRLPVLRASRTLRTRDLDAATTALRRWAIQRSVFRVRGEVPLAVGTEVAMRFLCWEFHCRVTALIDEPHRRGFVYGTLPGHLERGEESFVVQRDPDGSLTLVIEAHSEPATRWLKLARPVVNIVRAVILRAFYLRALDR